MGQNLDGQVTIVCEKQWSGEKSMKKVAVAKKWWHGERFISGIPQQAYLEGLTISTDGYRERLHTILTDKRTLDLLIFCFGDALAKKA